MPYRIVYVVAATFGPVLTLDKLIDFSDMMMLGMAFPNIIGMIFISGKVKKLTDDYIARLRAGKM
jgi:AGCS family alanine or glycine:cation symporter